MKKVKIILAFVVIGLFLVSIMSFSSSISSNSKIKDDIARIDFIHYAKSNAGGKPIATKCYSLMGVKWLSLPVNYAINPSNPFGLSTDFIITKISTSAETWDFATSKELFNSYSIDYLTQYGIQDYKNSIVFGNYPNENAIAVTSIWYSKKTKQIVEFDMIFNTKFNWGDSSLNPFVMDLQNIATHEFGHSIGLNDIYSTSCSSVTMFGYSYEGDVSKSSLEQPDKN